MVRQQIKQAADRLRKQMLSLNGTPQEIAMGIALGIMVGMTPFWGAQIAGSLLLATLMRCSKISAVIGANITNLITAPLIYPINYWVGATMIGASRQVAWPRSYGYYELIRLACQSPLIVVDLCAGGLMVGFPLAVMGYFITIRVIQATHPLIKKKT
jgi:uncharacterized protein (DUF2062 family)